MANARDVILSAFPWLAQLGIPVDQIQQWAVQGLQGETLLGEVRKTPQYQSLFPAIRRTDGTLRMSEAQYLSQSEEYRKLLRAFGDPQYGYDSPSDLAAFFEQEIDPNELKQRFQVYDTVKRGSQDLKDAFYVYAGMRPSDDQLYWAVVSPNARQALFDEYNQRVAQSPLDYQTFIQRATDAGLSRVVDKLQQLKDAGVVTGTAISQVQSLSPDFAKQMMDLLYHGGAPDTNRLLGLNELLHSFDYAMIGSAATQSGLALPDQQRVEAIRQAGVDRAKAMESYGQFASQQNLLAGMVQRAQLGTGFSQDDFEKAVFLHQQDSAGLMRQATAAEAALAKQSGAAAFSQDQQGRIAQRGLRVAFQ